MPKRRYWLSAMGCVVLLAMTLAACGTSSTPANTNNSPKSGGSLIDGISQEPSSLMPGQSTQTFADLVDASLWASLIYSTDQFTLAPGLLTEVPSVANGDIKVTNDASGNPATESFTLKLRSGLKFSDGSSLTSADVAFTIKTLSDPAYADKNGWPASEVASVTTPDAQTTVVNLNTIDVAFLTSAFTDPLLFTPLSQAHYSSMAPAEIAKDFQPAVTSGPFTVTERVKGDHITVKKNPNYYQAGKPYLNQITFKLFPDANTEVTALQAGQIGTAYFLPVTAVATLKNIPGYKLFVPKNSPNYEALYLNLSNPILADPQVRLAIAQGFDPKTEITDIQKGNAVATCDDSTGTFAHQPNLPQNGECAYGPSANGTYNPTAAGQVLDSDGWTMGSDGYRHKGGQTLDLRISTTSGRQYRLDSEQLFQAAMKSIGIKIDVNNYPSSDLFGPILFPSDSKYAKGNNQWDIAEFENSIGTDPDSHTIWDSNQTPPNGGSNLTYYNNPQVDMWEAQQLKTVDQTARAALFHQIQNQILKDIPTIYLYAPLDLSEYETNLHNYSPDSIGPSETWNIWDWWLS